MLWHPTHIENGLAFHLDNNFSCQTVDLRIAKTSDGQHLIGNIEFVETTPGGYARTYLAVSQQRQ